MCGARRTGSVRRSIVRARQRSRWAFFTASSAYFLRAASMYSCNFFTFSAPAYWAIWS